MVIEHKQAIQYAQEHG